MMTQAHMERSLTPSEAHALDLIRGAGSKGMNRFEAPDFGHGSLTQRVSNLQDKGFQFSHTREKWTDPAGTQHTNVVRYHYIGWKAFTPPKPEGRAINESLRPNSTE